MWGLLRGFLKTRQMRDIISFNRKGDVWYGDTVTGNDYQGG